MCRSEYLLAYAKIQLQIPYGNDSTINKFCKFIKELFDTDNIYVDKNTPYVTYYGSPLVTFTALNFNVPYKDNSEEWLNRCILLNTYREYLIAKTEINELKIHCGLHCYESETEMRSKICNDILNRPTVTFTGNLAINELIKINTSAQKELNTDCSSTVKLPLCIDTQDKWHPYDVVFSRLSENIKKRINN